MPKCSFCGNPLPEGRGKMLVKTSGQVLYFCNSKCQRNYELGRNPKKLKWVKKKKSK
ncbi:MAG: 50S ribosomal protein L24e [Candidatus Aenigmatarchaeota archaeon]|nr:MAG: 50S ribosomal protein L24e [Candidatus Aenigmarchaeota archaeon]